MMRKLPPAAALFLIAVLASCSTPPSAFDEETWKAETSSMRAEALYLPHFADGRFFTPWYERPDHGFGTVMRWRFFSDPEMDYSEEEKNFLPAVVPGAAKRMAEAAGRDYILWIGHNSFAIKIGGELFLTDPMFSDRALLPKRLTPPAVTAEDLSALGMKMTAIISHNHYDHLDSRSIKDLPDSTRVVTPLGLGDFARDRGKKDVIEMDWWDEAELSPGVRIVCLPAQHWSRRITQGTNTTLWASYLLITPEATIYLAMDSGYFAGYREIGRRFPGIDYALMPITAYHPRWFMHYAHMNIEETLTAFDELGAGTFIPQQWGTFPLGEEPPGYPYFDLLKTLEKDKRDSSRYRILDIGGMVFLK